MKRALASVGSFLAILLLALVGTPAFGQGVLIIDHCRTRSRCRGPSPRPTRPPPISYKIKELAYQAKIIDQVAQVQVAQILREHRQPADGGQFVFPLPYDGAIDRMTFMVDGKEYDAKLLPAKEARAIYEGLRPPQSGPGPAGMGRHGHVPDERLPGSRRAPSGR